MDLLNRTTLQNKKEGDRLKADDINTLNNTVNALVDCMNIYLKKYCDVNAESSRPGGYYTLDEAIEYVPVSRRSLGMTIKYLGMDGIYHSVVFLGKITDEDTWKDKNNWYPDNTVIDGGTWE